MRNKKLFVTFILLFIAIASIICFFPYWFTTRSFRGIDFTETGPIGDTIGGIIGPFIAIIAAFLTFLAFWAQYDANQQQKADLQVERFENKFYEMLRLHRDNVAEMTVGRSAVGKRVFLEMYKELKFTWFAVNEYFQLSDKYVGPNRPSDDVIYNITYVLFFFGIGNLSTPIVQDLLPEKYHALLGGLEGHFTRKKINRSNSTEERKAISISLNGEKMELKISHEPFKGHQLRYSHYIRHLFQFINFVHEADKRIIPVRRKMEYAATIRAQLSTHEQILLYYNALSILGQPWLDEPKHLLKRYSMVKSIPLPQADFYKNPAEVLGELNPDNENRPMFEWVAIKARFEELDKEKTEAESN